MPFAGKWSLTNGGLSVTLKDSGTGELDLQPTQKNAFNQQLNSYGDPQSKLWLQAGNWKYVVFSEPGYFASAQRSGVLAEFVLEPISGEQFRIVQKTDAGDFYCSANGSKLERIPKAGSPPASTVFVRNQISPGLAQLKFGAMGRNLRGVDFTGDDLTDFVFSGSDLSYAILRGTLKSATFQGCTVESADFTGVDLDNVTLTGIKGERPIFDRVILHRSTDLSGAQIAKASFVAARSAGENVGDGPTMNAMRADESIFNEARITGAVCNGSYYRDSQWINATLINSQAGSAHFEGASMERVDCNGAALQASFFDGAQMVYADFTSADITNSSFKLANLTNAKLSKVNGHTGIQIQGAQLIGANLNGLDLTSAGLDKDTVFLAAQMEGVNLTGHKLDSVNFVRAYMKGAKLDKTSMEHAVLVGANMSLASCTGNVSFVGADLSNCSMEGINLNGAQMGAKQAVGVLDSAALNALNQGQMPMELHRLFLARRLEPSAMPAVTIREPGKYWIVEDAGSEFHLEAAREAIQVSQVGGVPAAVLSNAYMPNADLSGANLYAVDMSGAHWYGSKARADNANMELINFSNANLATMNLTQAKMYGANLSFAIVAGTNFTGAKLTPTTQLRSASLAFASMQGATFTAAQIGGANLTNAAVSLEFDAPLKFIGVPLFPVPVTFVASLDKKRIDDDLNDLFKDNGYPLIDAATVVVDAKGSQWSIINYESGSTTLQAGYSNFILWKRDHNGVEEVAVFGGSPVFVIRTAANNEQEQGSIAFGPNKDLLAAIDDVTTTPSGMKYAMRNKGVTLEELMTGGLPPRPPKCIPSPDRWC